MRLVLDANEYIFALGLFRKRNCESLLELLTENFPLHSVSICRTIIEEVRTNLTSKDFHNFVRFINVFSVIDEDFLIPFETGVKYEAKGLKDADALIAAYTEWTGADALVSENRHFLSRHSNLSFKIIHAEECLKLIKFS